jgi:hypothetical protein
VILVTAAADSKHYGLRAATVHLISASTNFKRKFENQLSRKMIWRKPMAEFALTLLSFLIFSVAVLLLLGWRLQ